MRPRRGSGHEGGGLPNGISARRKGTPESCVTLPPREHASVSWKQAFTGHRICRHVGLGPSSLQNSEKSVSVVFKPPSLWNFVVPATA